MTKVKMLADYRISFDGITAQYLHKGWEYEIPDASMKALIEDGVIEIVEDKTTKEIKAEDLETPEKPKKKGK